MQDKDSALERTRRELNQAIEGQAYGRDNARYNHIKSIFTTSATAADAPSPAALRDHIVALTYSVSRLNRSCSGLVHAVLSCNWLGRDEAFVALFTNFLGNLVTAQGIYVGVVLSMLVENLCSASSSARRIPGYPRVRRRQIYLRTHGALQHVLGLVPSASSSLLPILTANFPHSSGSRRAHTDFVKNLIQLTQYVPELKAEVIGLVTERLVKIDVQVQADMEDLEDDEAAEEGLVGDNASPPRASQPADDSDDGSVSDSSSASDGDDDDDGDGDDDEAGPLGPSSSSASSSAMTAEQRRRMRSLRASVDKMDAILDLLFAFYAPVFAAGTSPAKTERAFELLLGHFATIILPTYRSRHTQFLLFHFAQTTPRRADQFAGTCLHLVCDRARPPLLRQAAAAYLASFVARGARVPAQLVRDVFQLVGLHLERIRVEQEPRCRGPDLRVHGAFHAMVQALLYIFCFRWRDLTENWPAPSSSSFSSLSRHSSFPCSSASASASAAMAGEDHDMDGDGDDDGGVDTLAIFGGRKPLRWMPGVKEVLTRMLYSKFNPLKVCSPLIVNEFARIAKHLQFMYIYPLLETNRRLHLAQLSRSSLPSWRIPAASSAYGGKGGGGAAAVAAAAAAVGSTPSFRDDSGGGQHQLDAYFPFDPYHLPNSKRWLEGDYVEWQGVPGLDCPITSHDRGQRDRDDDDDDDGGYESESDDD